LILSTNKPQELTINLRIPYWAQGGNVKINGTALPAFGGPSGYLALTRLWKSGAKIDLSLPMALHLAPMPDNEKIQSMMYGPLVLAGRFDPVTIQMMPSGDYEPKPTDKFKVADIVADPARPTAWVEAGNKEPLTFRSVGQSRPIARVPLYKIIREPYAVYWKTQNKAV
jgi:DUF1680 family protein